MIKDVAQLNNIYDEILEKFYGEDFSSEVIPPLMVLDSLNMDLNLKVQFLKHQMEKNQLAVFGMTSQVVMDLFATGKTSGIVIDSGYGHTQVAPIIEGLILKNFKISERICG